MKFKLGDTLICVKSQINGWTEGAEYEVKLEGGEPVLFDDEGDSWGVDFLFGWTDGRTELQFEKVEEEKRKEMKFKIGDKVFGKDVVNNSYYTGRIIEINHNLAGWGSYCIDTPYGNKWLINDTITKVEGENKMKFKVFDLNNLTTSELREYVELLEDKENAEFLLECFIEKVSK